MHSRATQSILARLRGQLTALRTQKPVRSFQSSAKMDTFFSQSPFRRPAPEPSIFERVSRFTPRRAYSQVYWGGPDPGVMRTVWTIITLNAAVFGAWQYAEMKKDRKVERQLYENVTLMEANIQAGRSHTLLTSAFSHRDVGHFAFNMFALHAFGSLLATVPGVSGVYVTALAVGSAAAGSVAWLYHLKTKSQSQSVSRTRGVWSGFGGGQITRHIQVGLGASGMVMGMGAAATLLKPFAPMYLMFIPIPIPLWILTTGYFAFDTYFLNSDTSRTGHSAHLGGAVFGAAFYFLALRSRGGIWTMLSRGLRRRR
ncbi:hypothetical protein PRZ48_011609 [Zasmidium cellare]|uniref:Peptidase S54 rhomboid domain-containing protein n=1 Tax=Zasmidium cellare TaxID=395010 RepID=A0ABR0E762_ZASCE|nr:hypothetical protein PRZ48_011609 [Zasmidium cellare]